MTNSSDDLQPGDPNSQPKRAGPLDRLLVPIADADKIPSQPQPGDPYSRLKREVPDAETLERLLAPVPEADRQWIRGEAVAAMQQKKLYPSVLLADQRWRCSRQAFEAWIRELSRATGWALPAFWRDEPNPTPPDTGKRASPKLRQIAAILARYNGGDTAAPRSKREALIQVQEAMKCSGLDQLPPYEAASEIEAYATRERLPVPQDHKTIVKYLREASEL